MFIGWEGVGLRRICDWVLVHEGFGGVGGEKKEGAFIVNRIGDFGFLIALFFDESNILDR